MNIVVVIYIIISLAQAAILSTIQENPDLEISATSYWGTMCFPCSFVIF